MPATMRDAALTAARRGWPVFPLLPGSKVPALHSGDNCIRAGECTDGHRKPAERATTDPDRIAAAWADRYYNIGLATGPAGLVVVDLDVPKPGDDAAPEPWNQLGIESGADVLAALAEKARQPWPQTHTVHTPSGGLHLYFRAPAGATLGNTAKKLGWKIDTRAGGGYVLAAGSVIAGRSYVVIDDRDPVDLPYWIRTPLTENPAPTQPTAPLPTTGRRVSAYTDAAIRDEQHRITAAPRGSHNHALNKAAYQLGRLVGARTLDYADARAALRAAADVHVQGECDCTGREVDAVIAAGLKAGANRPRTAAA